MIDDRAAPPFVCFEPDLPLALASAADDAAARIRPDNARDPEEAAGKPKKFWAPGSTLRVRFLDLPHPELVGVVMDAASEWIEYANLELRVVTRGTAEIRVTFAGTGNWSLFGTDATVPAADAPTMCLSELTKPTSSARVQRVPRHEFGHAIGLVHEHSSPVADIAWNKAAVYDALCPPKGPWTKKRVDQQVFRRYSEKKTNFTEFDPHSIMLYPIPAQWTLDGQAYPSNNALSEKDQEFARCYYPGRG